MFKNGKTALIVAIALSVLGTSSAALAGAKDDDGGSGGGYVIEGSMDGVNPVYHPDIFGRPSSAFAQSHAQTNPNRVHRKSSRY